MFWIQFSFVSTESFDLLNLSIYPLAYMVIGASPRLAAPSLERSRYLWVPQAILKIATINAQFW